MDKALYNTCIKALGHTTFTALILRNLTAKRYLTFKLLLDNEEYEKMSKACNPYGHGHACERIADILEGKEYHPWMPV